MGGGRGDTPTPPFLPGYLLIIIKTISFSWLHANVGEGSGQSEAALCPHLLNDLVVGGHYPPGNWSTSCLLKAILVQQHSPIHQQKVQLGPPHQSSSLMYP